MGCKPVTNCIPADGESTRVGMLVAVDTTRPKFTREELPLVGTWLPCRCSTAYRIGLYSFTVAAKVKLGRSGTSAASGSVVVGMRVALSRKPRNVGNRELPVKLSRLLSVRRAQGNCRTTWSYLSPIMVAPPSQERRRTCGEVPRHPPLSNSSIGF